MPKDDIKIEGEYVLNGRLSATFPVSMPNGPERARNRLIRRGMSRGYTLRTWRAARNRIEADVIARQPGHGTYKIFGSDNPQAGAEWTAHFVAGDNAACNSARSTIHGRAAKHGLRAVTKASVRTGRLTATFIAL